MYDYNRTWSRLFKKNVLGTKLEIYVSIGPFSRQNMYRNWGHVSHFCLL